MTKSVELVFGAGGVKGYFHIGLLKAIEELGILVDKVTGVSVGAIVASFYTNGMNSDQILKLFLESHEKSGNPLLLASAFAGRERLLAAYREAVSLGYRLYSFGDATLIL